MFFAIRFDISTLVPLGLSIVMNILCGCASGKNSTPRLKIPSISVMKNRKKKVLQITLSLLFTNKRNILTPSTNEIIIVGTGGTDPSVGITKKKYNNALAKPSQFLL